MKRSGSATSIAAVGRRHVNDALAPHEGLGTTVFLATDGGLLAMPRFAHAFAERDKNGVGTRVA